MRYIALISLLLFTACGDIDDIHSDGGVGDDASGSNTPGPDSGPPGSCGNAMETENFNITNEERKRNGLQPLICDPIATKTAREYSAWMCRDRFFSHTGPDGSSPATRLRSNGASFMGAGENIAAGASDAQRVHTGWMNSPGHRANILRTSYRRLGVGYVACPGGRYRHYWTQNFLM